MLIDELKQKNLEEKDKTIKIESVCIKGFLIVFPLVVIGIVAYILINRGTMDNILFNNVSFCYWFCYS